MAQFALVKIIDDEAPLWLELAAAYLAHAQANKAFNTIRCVDKPTINRFSAFIGNPRISAITRTDADRFCLEMRKKMKPNSARTRIVVIRMIFKYAVEEGLLIKNPFNGIRLPKQTHAGRNLTDVQITAFLAALPELHQRACILGLCTGMRRGEVLGLTWEQVGADQIHIPAEKSKSGRERDILLRPEALAALGPRQLTGSVFGLTEAKLGKSITSTWRTLGYGRIRFHDLRHTAASRYMDESDDIFVMLDAFGWASESSARPYQHMTRKRRERLLRICYPFLFNALEPPGPDHIVGLA